MIDQLGLNETYFYQLGFFLATFLLLKVTYFAPLSRLIQLRHKRTTADNAEAEGLESQNATDIQGYKDRLAVVRGEIRTQRDLALKEARLAEGKVVAAAREEAKKVSQAAVAEAESVRQAALKSLSGEIDGLASGLTKKLLSEQR